MLAVVVVLYNCLAPYRRVVVVVLDAIVAAFLFATFVYGAYSAGGNHGACASPARIGVWDNRRGCTRMTISASFAALSFISFMVSAVLAGLL